MAQNVVVDLLDQVGALENGAVPFNEIAASSESIPQITLKVWFFDWKNGGCVGAKVVHWPVQKLGFQNSEGLERSYNSMEAEVGR